MSYSEKQAGIRFISSEASLNTSENCVLIYEACVDRVLANSGQSIYFFAQWQGYLLEFQISLL